MEWTFGLEPEVVVIPITFEKDKNNEQSHRQCGSAASQSFLQRQRRQETSRVEDPPTLPANAAVLPRPGPGRALTPGHSAVRGNVLGGSISPVAISTATEHRRCNATVGRHAARQLSGVSKPRSPALARTNSNAPESKSGIFVFKNHTRK